MAYKVFISHSVNDKEIVEAMVKLLRNGMDLKKEEIFCTSMYGTIRTGEDFINKIRENVRECEVVLLMLSHQYTDSFFCQVECGAAWALGKSFKPIIIPPMDFSELEKPMDTHQAIKITDKKGIRLLYDELVNQKVIQGNTNEFEEALEIFCKEVDNCITCPKEENGYITVKVKEIYPEDKKDYLKIEGKINIEILKKVNAERLEMWDEEEHWLDFKYHKNKNVKVGDVLKIKVKGSKFYEHLKHNGKDLYNVRNIYFY